MIYSFLVVKELVSSVELEFSVWVIYQNSVVREVRVLSFLGDKHKWVPRESVINAEVEYFSTVRDVDKKLSLMSPARDTRL